MKNWSIVFILMGVLCCLALDFDIETVRFLYAKNKAHKTPLYVNEPSNTRC